MQSRTGIQVDKLTFSVLFSPVSLDWHSCNVTDNLNPELALFPHWLKTYYVPGIGNGNDVMKHFVSVVNQIHNNETHIPNVGTNADSDVNMIGTDRGITF